MDGGAVAHPTASDTPAATASGTRAAIHRDAGRCFGNLNLMADLVEVTKQVRTVCTACYSEGGESIARIRAISLP